MQREWTEAIGGVYSCIKEHPLSHCAAPAAMRKRALFTSARPAI